MTDNEMRVYINDHVLGRLQKDRVSFEDALALLSASLTQIAIDNHVPLEMLQEAFMEGSAEHYANHAEEQRLRRKQQ